MTMHKLQIDFDFKATVRQNKTTGQKLINIPLSVDDKFETGQTYFWVALRSEDKNG